jgi:hypothetical protein
MAEVKGKDRSAERATDSTKAAGERVSDYIEEGEIMIGGKLDAARKIRDAVAQQTKYQLGKMLPEVGYLVDETGAPIEIVAATVHDLARMGGFANEVINLSLEANEFERLSAKTAEILQEAALAYERIAKDQEEIEQLKTETRAMLGQLHAA